MARGHLRQRSPGSWTIDLYLGIDPVTGKKRYKSETVRGTKAQAERRRNELVHQLDTGAYVEPAKETVAQFLQTWLRDYAEVSVKPDTYEGYRSQVNTHLVPALGQIPVRNLAPRHIQTFESALLREGLSARTVLHLHRRISQALTWGVKMGVLQRNAAAAVQPPRPQRREFKTLTWESVHDFLDAARDSKYLPLWLTALLTGLRRSEFLALRWRDLDLTAGTLSVTRRVVQLETKEMDFAPPKNGRPRMVTLPHQAVAVLQRIREIRESEREGLPWNPEGLVFSKPDGRPLRPATVSTAFRRLARRTGNHGLRLHDLRHTHASLMLAAGIHLKVISERLGHSSISVTGDLYSHVLPGLQEEAVIKWEENFDAAKPEDWQKNGKAALEV